MNLEDYMILRHPMGKVKALTSAECRILGIEYTKGWFNKNREMNIDKYLPALFKVIKKQTLKNKLMPIILNLREEAQCTVGKFLYVMQNETGLIKIGISKHPYRRAIQLSNQSGILVSVLKIYVVDQDINYVESFLHKKFKKYRLLGE